jgi:hypothetical protein
MPHLTLRFVMSLIPQDFCDRLQVSVNHVRFREARLHTRTVSEQESGSSPDSAAKAAALYTKRISLTTQASVIMLLRPEMQE